MAHLKNAEAAQLAELADELALATAAMGFEPNSLKIMAHRPDILRGFLALSAAVLGPNAALEPGLRQMIAHIASAAAGCNYCQAHTAHGAHERGVADEKIAAFGLIRPIRNFPRPSAPLWRWRRPGPASPMAPRKPILTR